MFSIAFLVSWLHLAHLVVLCTSSHFPRWALVRYSADLHIFGFLSEEHGNVFLIHGKQSRGISWRGIYVNVSFLGLIRYRWLIL